MDRSRESDRSLGDQLGLEDNQNTEYFSAVNWTQNQWDGQSLWMDRMGRIDLQIYVKVVVYGYMQLDLFYTEEE